MTKEEFLRRVSELLEQREIAVLSGRLDNSGILTVEDRKYLRALEMRKDRRSMAYIAKELGYKTSSGVDYLLKHYPRGRLLDALIRK